MVYKNLEDMTGSDVAEETLKPLLSQVKDSQSPILFCSLVDKVKYVKTGEMGLVLDHNKIIRKPEELPSDAEIYLQVLDSEQHLLGCYRIGSVERELYGDNNFRGYDEHAKSLIRQQVGLILRYLKTFNKDIYFRDKIEGKNFVEVDSGLVEELLVHGTEPTLGILHL